MTGTHRLFAYGSLMFPEIWTLVMGREHPCEPASILGYAALRVRGAEYPGLVPADGLRVEGVLYAELSDADIGMLDRFEAWFYRRITVAVTTRRGPPVEAHTYLVEEAHRGQLSGKRWDAEAFAAAGLSRMAARLQGIDPPEAG